MSRELKAKATLLALCAVMPGGFIVLGAAVGRSLWKSRAASNSNETDKEISYK